MNAPEPLAHETAAELLPWLVNDTLDEDEKAAVRAHAGSCVICRRELTDLERLRDTIAQTPDLIATPEPDMRRINARIDALIEQRNTGQKILYRIRDWIEAHWRVALLAQSIVLVLVTGLLLIPGPPTDDFETLTEASKLPDGRYIRVVFSPDLPQPEISALLEIHGLTVVEGPTRRGVFTLDLAGASSTGEYGALLSNLQQDPRVLFAQPVQRGENQ